MFTMFAKLFTCDNLDNVITSAHHLRDCLGFGELKGINLTDTFNRDVLIRWCAVLTIFSICYNLSIACIVLVPNSKKANTEVGCEKNLEYKIHIRLLDSIRYNCYSCYYIANVSYKTSNTEEDDRWILIWGLTIAKPYVHFL